MCLRLLMGITLSMCTVAKLSAEPALPMDLPRAEAVDRGRIDTPPRLTKRGRGDYPEHLVRTENYVQGVVEARIHIGIDGAIKSVNVLRSTHPAFVTATITQLNESKFSPALRDGLPIETHAVFTASFDVRGHLGRNISGGVIMTPAKPADLPPELDYDWSPVMKSYCEPVFPYEALENGVGGHVNLRVFLDARGLVERTEVVSATSPEFSLAMQAAIETWTFIPAAKNRMPTPTMFYVERKFHPASYRRPVAENQSLKTMRKGAKSFASPASLDRAPTPIYQVAPQYPRALLGEKPTGEATIEFVIYQTGEVTIPKVRFATRPEFGFAAANAVQQWVFERPMVRGRPVSVRTQMTFEFKP